MSWVTFWTTAAAPIGLVVGYGVKMLDDFLKEDRAAKREAARRSTERDDAARDRRDTFQRESLLALQQAMHDLTISALEYDFEGTHGIANDSTFNKLTDAQVRVSMFTVRILDDMSRTEVQAFNDTLKRMGAATNRATADDLARANRNANDRIGEVLRALY